jgi:hypothetical protein
LASGTWTPISANCRAFAASMRRAPTTSADPPAGCATAPPDGDQSDDETCGERGWNRPTPARGCSDFSTGLVGERTHPFVVLDEKVEAAHRTLGIGIRAPVLGICAQPILERFPVSSGAIRRMNARIPSSRGIRHGFAVFTHEVHFAYDVAARLPPTFFMQTAKARLMCFSTIFTEIPQCTAISG